MDYSLKISLAVSAAGTVVAIAGATWLVGPAALVVGGLAVAAYGLFGIRLPSGPGDDS